jgi:hypothetical protein
LGAIITKEFTGNTPEVVILQPDMLKGCIHIQESRLWMVPDTCEIRRPVSFVPNSTFQVENYSGGLRVIIKSLLFSAVTKQSIEAVVCKCSTIRLASGLSCMPVPFFPWASL